MILFIATRARRLLPALCTFFLPLAAGQVAVINPSFELASAGAALTAGIYSHAQGQSQTYPYGWEVSGSIEVVRAGYAGFWTAQDGLYSVDLNGMGPGGIRQQIGGFSRGASYELVFGLSSNRAWCGSPGSCPVRVTIDGVSRDVPAGGPATAFRDVVIPFTANGASVDLRLASVVAGGPGGPVIDNIRIREVATAPKPAPAQSTPQQPDLERRPASGLVGRVTSSSGPTGQGVPGVRVFAGKLELKEGAQTDTLMVDPLAGETLTDQGGYFQLNVPKGIYDLVLWKQGYEPRRERGVTAPDRWLATIAPDTRRVSAHQSLSIERPGPGPVRTKTERLLSLNRPASLSSRVAGSAKAGNDGVKNGNWGFKTVDDQRGQWWQVDLQAECVITEVRVYNSVDFQPWDAKYFEVWFGGGGWVKKYRHNGTHPGGADGKPARIRFNNAGAQYVRIMLPDAASLHLDEVEVYGWEATGVKQPELSREQAPPEVQPTHQPERSPERLSLGNVWRVREANPQNQGCDGVWTRRPGTAIFDARWNCVGGAVVDTLRIESEQGREVVVYRDGLRNRYYLTFSQDRRRIVSGRIAWAPGWTFSGTVED